MAEMIVILLPPGFTESQFKEYLSEKIEDLWPAFNLELNDDRASVDEVVIDEVEIFDDTLIVHYRVDFSAYYGCRDMNYSDYDVRYIEVRRKDRVLEFDRFVPPEPRTTFEEF